MDIRTYLSSLSPKRCAMCVAGNVILGAGVAFFRLSAMGNDPFNDMNMALAAKIGISYPILQIAVNVIFFAIQLFFGKDLIGLGTVVNALLLGHIADGCHTMLVQMIGKPSSLLIRIPVMLIGMLLCSLGISLYQRSDLGVSPYDSQALILDRKLDKIPYFWCRIFCDGACTLICFLSGGIVGLGTLVSALGFGPFIDFFNRTVSDPLLKK